MLRSIVCEVDVPPGLIWYGNISLGEFVIVQQLENRSKFVQHVRAEPFHTSNETKLACDNNGVVFSHFVKLKKKQICVIDAHH